MAIPAKPPIRVIVGTGYTGLRVLNALPSDESLGINRTTVKNTSHEVLAIDLDARNAPTIELPESCALLYTVPPAADSLEDRRLALFLERIKSAPQRIVYLSTSGVYGDRQGDVTVETDPINPSTDRAKRRLNAERMLEQWCGEEDCDLVLLRLPGIYGPGRLGLERLREGAAIICEPDTGPGNRIHVDDLVTCCIAALSGHEPAGIYNIADGDHRSNNWFRRTVANHAGLAPPPEISLSEAKKTWSKKRVSFLTESRKLDSRKLRTILKVKPRYEDAEDGIRASLSAENAEYQR